MGGYQDHGWAEDYDLWLRLFEAGAQFAKVPEVLLEWRDHPNRLTHIDGRYSPFNDLRLKVHYLVQGPLSNCDQVILWGNATSATALGGQLLNLGVPVASFVAETPLQLGPPFQNTSTITLDELFNNIKKGQRPIVLVTESDPSHRALIAQQFDTLRFRQGINWWQVG